MRILITGASSLLGQKIIHQLIAQNHEIVAICSRSDFNLPGTKILVGDIRDNEFLTASTKNIQTIIHLAAITHTNKQKDYYLVNTQATKCLIEAARQNGVEKIIYMSTRVIGDKKTAGAYGHSKLLAEEVVKKSNLKWTIFRPAEIYGPGFDSSMVNKLIGTIKNKKIIPVVGRGDYLLAPVLVDDVIGPVTRSIEQEITNYKIYTLAGPESITLNQLIDLIANSTQRRVKKLYLPVCLCELILGLLALLSKNPSFVRDQIPRLMCYKENNIHSAKRDLSFEPMGLEIGLRKVLDLR